MAILSGIIVNEKLKLMQINYLARKVDFLKIFLLGHMVLVTELMAGPTIQSLSTKLRSKLQHQMSSNSAPQFSKCNMWTTG
jgi:hypothetical protein